MKPLAAVGDSISGGDHCHGHDHGPRPTPGTVVRGSDKVFVGGRAAARDGDPGFSPACCAGIGEIELEASQSKVFIEGRAAVGVGSPTKHCKVGPGKVAAAANTKIFIP